MKWPFRLVYSISKRTWELGLGGKNIIELACPNSSGWFHDDADDDAEIKRNMQFFCLLWLRSSFFSSPIYPINLAWFFNLFCILNDIISWCARFRGNPDLCGRQVDKQCRTSLGFPAVLPHAESDEAAGNFSLHWMKLFTTWDESRALISSTSRVTNSAFYFTVPTKRSSHYSKGLLIGAISTAGFVLVILLVFMWTRLLSKKERTAKTYMEVKKQKNRETSELFTSILAFFFICI